MNLIAGNIKRLRRQKGLSQEQFAQALCVTRQTVSAWERGISLPGLDTLGEMARVLEVKPEQLIYGIAGEKKPIYKRVSFRPIVWVIPLFYFVVLWVLPILFFPISGGRGGDLWILLSGQLFLAILIMFCYCSLKDEVRNWKYYEETADEPSIEE